MERNQLSKSEWHIMELLWQRPHTLMELVGELSGTVGWSKSTVATMVRRMDAKGIITYEQRDNAKLFRPALTREEASLSESREMLDRAYHGSVGLLVNALFQAGELTQSDLDELYAVLEEARGERHDG